jgi:hypothetical protein
MIFTNIFNSCSDEELLYSFVRMDNFKILKILIEELKYPDIILQTEILSAFFNIFKLDYSFHTILED